MLLVSASTASASNTFGLVGTQTSGNSVELGTIVADASGVVDVYKYQAGQKGRLLGFEAINAGANSDVDVRINGTVAKSYLVLMRIDAQIVDQNVLRIED